MKQSTIEKRKEQWVRFHESAGPGYMFFVDCPVKHKERCESRPHLWPDKKGERIEWAWEGYQDIIYTAEWLDDDRIPYLENATGTEIFAEALGCKVERPDHTNPFAMPLIHSASDVAKIKVPELSTSTLAYLFEIADELYRRGGPEATMSLVDIQSPMDIAALVWEKSSFFMAMLDASEAVKELCSKCYQLLTAFLDEWFSRYGTDYVAHFPDYFMRGGLTLSEDEIGAVNGEMFEMFFKDELVNLSEQYGGLGVHCCADAGHQWHNLKRIPGLKVLNLCIPPNRSPKYISDAYQFFADGPAQMHCGWIPDGDIEELPFLYAENAKIILQVNTKTSEEATKICANLQCVRNQNKLGF